MLYTCTLMATVSVKGVKEVGNCIRKNVARVAVARHKITDHDKHSLKHKFNALHAVLAIVM